MTAPPSSPLGDCRPAWLNVGAVPTGTDALCEAVAADLTAAGFRAESGPEVMQVSLTPVEGRPELCDSAQCSGLLAGNQYQRPEPGCVAQKKRGKMLMNLGNATAALSDAQGEASPRR